MSLRTKRAQAASREPEARRRLTHAALRMGPVDGLAHEVEPGSELVGEQVGVEGAAFAQKRPDLPTERPRMVLRVPAETSPATATSTVSSGRSTTDQNPRVMKE